MIPKQMIDTHQWVIWKYETVNERLTKVPYTTDGRKASTINPATWCNYDTAYSAIRDCKGDGVGFVFTKNDPFIGIDWDHCIDSNGCIKTEVYEEVKSVGSYAEFSPSGTGIHVICMGVLPRLDRCRGNDREIYNTGRFFTVTGKHIDGTPKDVRLYESGSIERIFEKIVTKKEPNAVKTTPFKYTPIKSFSTRESRDVFRDCTEGKYKEKFKSLMGGDISGYPSHSEADLALCNIIADHTDNPITIDYIFRNSKLMRDKWDRIRSGISYGDATIQSAIHGKFMRSLRNILEADDES